MKVSEQIIAKQINVLNGRISDLEVANKFLMKVLKETTAYNLVVEREAREQEDRWRDFQPGDMK